MANWFPPQQAGRKGSSSPPGSPPSEPEEELLPPHLHELDNLDAMDAEVAADVFGNATDFSTPVLIRPGLYLGSLAAERDLAHLQRIGVTHVMQVGMSPRPRHPDALVYTAVRAPDLCSFDLFHALIRSRAFHLIDAARATGGVLVHCAAGRSRSAAVAVAYLMRSERLSAEAALASVRRVRWICPNVGFMQQLQAWEELACDASAWPQPDSPRWPKQVSTGEPAAPARAPPRRAALDIVRTPPPRRLGLEIVRGQDVLPAAGKGDWAEWEESGLAPRPPRRGLDMRREAFLPQLEREFLAGPAPLPDQAPPVAAPAQQQQQPAAQADAWAQFAEVELPAAPAQKPATASLAPGQQLPAGSIRISATASSAPSARPSSYPRPRPAKGAPGGKKLAPPLRERRHCGSARERFDLRAALEAAGLRPIGATGSPYPPVRFTFDDPSGKPPTPIGIEYPDQARPRCAPVASASAAAAAAAAAADAADARRVSFSFSFSADFPRQQAEAPLVRAF